MTINIDDNHTRSQRKSLLVIISSLILAVDIPYGRIQILGIGSLRSLTAEVDLWPF